MTFPYPHLLLLGGSTNVAVGSTPALVTTGTPDFTTTNTTFFPAYPTGIQANDILLMHVHLTDAFGSASITGATGGWTLDPALDQPLAGSDFTGRLYWKRATGTESGTETVTLSEVTSPGVAVAIISAWRGCKATGTPYEGAAQNFQASTTAHVGSAVTTTGPNRKVITVFGCSNVNTTGAPTNGWTEEWETGFAGGNAATINGNSLEVASAGSVAACTRTQAAASTALSFTVALIPING